MNSRRFFLHRVGAVLAGVQALPGVEAAESVLRRVGVLAPSTAAKEERTLAPFFDEMRKLGWIEGQTIAYDRAYADDVASGLAWKRKIRFPKFLRTRRPASGVCRRAS